MLLAVLVIIKVIMGYLFNDHLEGTGGFLFAVFKWYGEEDQHFEELASRRFMMRVHNIFTFGIYFMMILILIVSVIPMFLG